MKIAVVSPPNGMLVLLLLLCFFLSVSLLLWDVFNLVSVLSVYFHVPKISIYPVTKCKSQFRKARLQFLAANFSSLLFVWLLLYVQKQLIVSKISHCCASTAGKIPRTKKDETKRERERQTTKVKHTHQPYFGRTHFASESYRRNGITTITDQAAPAR